MFQACGGLTLLDVVHLERPPGDVVKAKARLLMDSLMRVTWVDASADLTVFGIIGAGFVSV